MLSTDYSNNGHTELKSRALNLRVSYTPELAAKLNTAINFMMAKLGFVPEVQFNLSGDSIGKPITLMGAEASTLTLIFQIHENNSNIKDIIFHTDDCLRDYHSYILSGVEFINRPQYNASGLQVNFIDHEDNCYILLEERNYTES